MQLPVDDAARVLALSEMFPGKTPESIITEVLGAALSEIETEMPYVQGDRVIRLDEFSDPVYEDAGMTPRFLELARKYAKELQ